MPDITMCKETNCPEKQDCYRYTAIPNEHWQSYFAEPPMTTREPFVCKHFWNDKGRKDLLAKKQKRS